MTSTAAAPRPLSSVEQAAPGLHSVHCPKATVTVSTQGAEKLYSVISAEGQPILEYNSHTGVVQILGNLSSVQLDSERPALGLTAQGDLNLSAGGVVRIRGQQGLNLEVGEENMPATSAAHVTSHGITLASRHLRLVGQKAALHFKQLELTGERLESVWSRVQLASEKLDLRSGDVNAKMKTLVQDVEESLTLRAQRVRQWVRGSIVTRAERSDLRAKKSVRIDAKSINLG